MNTAATITQKPSLRQIMAAANDLISLCNVYTRNQVNHHSFIVLKRGAHELSELCFGIKQEYDKRFAHSGNFSHSDSRHQWEDENAPQVMNKLNTLVNALESLANVPGVSDMGFRSEKGNRQ